MLFRRDLPQLFEPEPELLRLAAIPERKPLLENLAEAAAGTLREERVFRAQLHAAGEAVLVMPVLCDAHVAGSNPGNRTGPVEQHLGGGKARINFNAQGFRLGGQPAADTAERDHVVAVVAHQRRQHEIGQTHGARCPEPVETIVADFGLDGGVFVAPVRDQPVEADGIDHRAREDMRPDFRSLFDNDHAGVGRKLLEPDRRGEPGGSRADDHDIELHRLAGGQIFGAHGLLQGETERARCGSARL